MAVIIVHIVNNDSHYRHQSKEHCRELMSVREMRSIFHVINDQWNPSVKGRCYRLGETGNDHTIRSRMTIHFIDPRISEGKDNLGTVTGSRNYIDLLYAISFGGLQVDAEIAIDDGKRMEDKRKWEKPSRPGFKNIQERLESQWLCLFSTDIFHSLDRQKFVFWFGASGLQNCMDGRGSPKTHI